jgi:hypothetical protein
MNDEHEDMKSLADRVEGRAEYADMTDACRNQFRTASGNAMRAIFNSHDHHESGNTQAAHAGLLVAGKHIDTAAKLVEGAYGYPVEFGSAMRPKDEAESITNSYKYAFRS